MTNEKSITFAIHTIGCKTNQAESDDIARQLVLRGCCQTQIPDAVGAADAAGANNVADAVDNVDVACAAGANNGIDYIIINTCTVTAAADRKVRHLIRKLKSASPKSKLIVTGCFAELNMELIKDIHADFVFSNSRKKEIADFICNTGCVKDEPAAEAMPAAMAASTAEITGAAEPTARAGLETASNTTAEPAAVMHPAGETGQKTITGKSKEALKLTSVPVAAATAISPAEVHYAHSRAFVKIQDGCCQGCTYCIVPLARGTYLSTDPAKIINDIKMLVSLGHEEIVLTGIHIGKFGVDLLLKKDEIKTLPELIIAILKNTDLKRLRLSSIEINEIDESLIGVIRNNRPRIAPHLHIPLQSGSDNVLKAMNRRYDRNFFISAIEHIKKAIPSVTLTTDAIVGFPGETGQDFMDTVELVKNINFSRLHVFKYSIRPGTRAAGMPGQVQENIKTKRSQSLRELGLVLRNSFMGSNTDKNLDVVCEEHDRKSGIAAGTSENYIKVYFDLNFEEYKLKKGKILKVFAKSLYADGLYGEVVRFYLVK